MRAVEPLESGLLTVAGFQIAYDTYGNPDAPAILFLPSWQIVDRRIWKMQIPHFSRTNYVIAFDGPRLDGDEQTDKPEAFEFDRIVDQSIGLLDHLGVQQVAVAGFSRGCAYAITMAARYPERVTALILISNGVKPDMWATPPPGFRERRESYIGWEKYNQHYWHEHYDEWLEFFFGEVFSEPHSTRAIEEGTSWARETTPEILALTEDDPSLLPAMPVADAIAAVRCPVLMIHGDDARCTPIDCTLELSSLRSDWPLVVLEGAGQAPQMRDPVRVNEEISRFLGSTGPERRVWKRAASRDTPRALFVSSPIGLGHVQRDLAIARELRHLAPDLDIDWLATGELAREMAAMCGSDTSGYRRHESGAARRAATVIAELL